MPSSLSTTGNRTRTTPSTFLSFSLLPSGSLLGTLREEKIILWGPTHSVQISLEKYVSEGLEESFSSTSGYAHSRSRSLSPSLFSLLPCSSNYDIFSWGPPNHQPPPEYFQYRLFGGVPCHFISSASAPCAFYPLHPLAHTPLSRNSNHTPHPQHYVGGLSHHGRECSC